MDLAAAPVVALAGDYPVLILVELELLDKVMLVEM
jgi:hypothetical protein